MWFYSCFQDQEFLAILYDCILCYNYGNIRYSIWKEKSFLFLLSYSKQNLWEMYNVIAYASRSALHMPSLTGPKIQYNEIEHQFVAFFEFSFSLF